MSRIAPRTLGAAPSQRRASLPVYARKEQADPMQPAEPNRKEENEPRIEVFSGNEQHLAALTAVRNETLQRTTPPDDFQLFSPDDMRAYYEQGGFHLAGNAWLMYVSETPVAASVLYPPSLYSNRPPGNFHLYVVPGEWRHGLGARLLAFVEGQAAGLGFPTLETTIAEEDHQSTQFLRRHGFLVVGHTHHLVRPNLQGLEQVRLAEGYTIQSLAALGEPPEFYAEITNRLGAYDANYSLVTSETLDAEKKHERFSPGGILFLFDPAGRIVGLIKAQPGSHKRGVLQEIRLEPSSRGKGLGAALVAEALQFLHGVGAERAELDTAGENVAARNLALRAGFVESRHWLHFVKRIQAPQPYK